MGVRGGKKSVRRKTPQEHPISVKAIKRSLREENENRLQQKREGKSLKKAYLRLKPGPQAIRERGGGKFRTATCEIAKIPAAGNAVDREGSRIPRSLRGGRKKKSAY